MATPYMKRGSVQPAQMSRHHKMMGIKICDSMLVYQPSRNKSIKINPRHLLLVADPAPSKALRVEWPGDLPAQGGIQSDVCL
jgi:hypothetical protein